MLGDLRVIINPVSGAGWTGRNWPALAERLEAMGWRLHCHITAAPGEATAVVAHWLRSGAREILSVGGDGTANEVANGFFAEGRPLAPDAVLSVLPAGTGRDFARNLGLLRMADALAALAGQRVGVIDVGRALVREHGRERERCFLNAADMGVGALAAARAAGRRKRLGGGFTYLFSAVQAIRTFQPQTARVLVDGALLSQGATAVVLIANGRFHGGGIPVAPLARMDDGRLDVFVLPAVSRARLALSLLPQVRRGRHMGHPAVRHAQGQAVQVNATTLPVELDGEYLGLAEVTVSLLPNALRVRLPG